MGESVKHFPFHKGDQQSHAPKFSTGVKPSQRQERKGVVMPALAELGLYGVVRFKKNKKSIP